MLEIKQTRTGRVTKHGKKAAPFIRVLRNIFITFFILVVLMVGAAMAYTWYNGKYGTQTVTKPVVKKGPAVRTPSKPSPTGPVGASVQMLTTPVVPGENASISVKTNANANCSIVVTNKDVPMKDSGLIPKAADDYGMAIWTWTIPPTMTDTTLKAGVTCANLKNSGFVAGDVVVKR